MSSQGANCPIWRSHYYTLQVEVAKLGRWELTVTSTQNGSCWEWTAVSPDWKDDAGKQYQGASFAGCEQTKREAKRAAETKATHTLLG